MKKIIQLPVIITLILFSITAMAQTKDVNKWYDKKEWLNGLAMTPHESIDKVIFARQYKINKKYWDKAFAFLKNTDLKTIKPGKHVIDGDNVYAMITEAPTKDFDSSKWESHHNYIDLQAVLEGEEKIGVADVSKLSITMPYDASKDLINYSGDGKYYTAGPGTFFLFFPPNAHRPGITTNNNKPDKKLVIKIRYAE